MKVFDNSNSFQGKINFVDENNIYIGYDLEQKCCEKADWTISYNILHEIPKELNYDKDLEDYLIDTNFFLEKDIGEANVVIFRLISKNLKLDKYLHLFNCQNGYYGHEFIMKKNENILKKDTI